MKNKLKAKLSMLLCLLVALPAASCMDDEDGVVANPSIELWKRASRDERAAGKADAKLDSTYLLRVGRGGLNGEGMAEVNSYLLYTNMGSWTLRATPGFEEYLKVFPEEGHNEGHFAFDVNVNPTIDTQVYALNLLDKKGNVQASIKIRQDASDPVLTIAYPQRSAPSAGETFELTVTANSEWKAWVGNDSTATTNDWLQLGTPTANSRTEMLLPITVAANVGTEERVDSVRIHLVRAGLERMDKVLVIKQFDPAHDLANATKRTIAGVLQDYSQTPSKTIMDNVYIEATVISDYSKRGLPKGHLIVEDDSRSGMWFELLDADNASLYKLNDKVKVHLYGATFITYPTNIGIQLAGQRLQLTSSLIENLGATEGITPEVVDDISLLQDPAYDNTLVTLKSVEFCLPRGVYVNIEDADILNAVANPLKPYSSWSTTADPYSDCTLEFGHIMRDPAGNTMKLYTWVTFLDRFARLMPYGSGSVTGIVMKRKSKAKTTVKDAGGNAVYSDEYVLRLRSDADNQVSSNSATALSNDIVRIGPFPQLVAMAGISSQVGTATLTASSRIPQNVVASTSGTPDAFYYGNGYSRMDACEVIDDETLAGTPTVAYGSGISYRDINTQYWWASNSSSITSGTGVPKGEAWIITVNMVATSGPGKLFLQYLQSSSTSGPGSFTIEWSTVLNAPHAEWVKLYDYKCCDIDNSQHAMQYVFALPDDMKGLNQVYIRIRVSENKRATGTGSEIGTSGTNRMGMLRITQLKN
ncbi:MAG: DUF5689 domain-containing protein [Prevotellaceae bacterium]|jgi:hypothetical protein|nr:DUF5689 domain-containing protein [Prevotellaceae bacterium]